MVRLEAVLKAYSDYEELVSKRNENKKPSKRKRRPVGGRR